MFSNVLECLLVFGNVFQCWWYFATSVGGNWMKCGCHKPVYPCLQGDVLLWWAAETFTLSATLCGVPKGQLAELENLTSNGEHVQLGLQ